MWSSFKLKTLLFTSDGPWTIHDLKAAEAARILGVLRQDAQWLQKKGSKQWSAFLEGGEDIVAKRFAEGLVLLVERGGKDAATMTVQMHDDFWDELGRDNQAAWIQSLGIAPPFMGRGLGRAMLKFAESLARAKHKDYLRLDVLDRATKLKAFYAKHGFKELGLKEHEGEKIRLMELDLT